MQLSACVACKLPVVELEGQFTVLDSAFIEDDGPPPATAGEWHTTCLRASTVGEAWQRARVKNFTSVRGYAVAAELTAWTVLREPHRGKTFAFGKTGERVDLSIGGKLVARAPQGGLVFPIVEPEFHLHLADSGIATTIQNGLIEAGAYPLRAILEALGLGEHIADGVALDNGAFRLDADLRKLWTPLSVSARAEYGVFIPSVLEPFVGEVVR